MQIPKDKRLHFLTGIPGGLVVGFFLSWKWALGVAMLPGPLKEAMDAWQNYQARKAGRPDPHSVEFLDAAATTLGAWLGVALMKLLRP